MLLIRCTRKLRQAMAIEAETIAPSTATTPTALTEWYADLVRVGAKKIIVFTHASTLFSIVALDVRRLERSKLEELLLSRLPVILSQIERHQSGMKAIAQMRGDCRYAATADRRVLGSMNELIRSLKLYIEGNGGIEQSDEVGLSLRLSETLMGAIGYERPIDRFRALLNRMERQP
jgi:hypothetical protein